MHLAEEQTLANKPKMAGENTAQVSEMKDKDQITNEPYLDAISFPLNREQMGERKFNFLAG